MKKIILVLFLGIQAISFSQNTNESLGKSFITDYLIDKNIEKSSSYFADEVKGKITPEMLSQTSTTLEKQLGKFKSVLETNHIENTYFYYSAFDNMKLDIKISFNDNSKIVGFFFSPHKEFTTEKRLGKELSIKSNSVNLNGTLLVPEKNNLKKLVIFVHGSGPNDRDEKSYENRPFKDIAESLYSKGIASYRFDKRTFSHPESFKDNSTIDDEVTNDVVNIVSYFKSNPDFSDYEIIVLGHSLGAYMMPRIANKSNEISKIIMMAGNARPLSQLLVEQYDYLYSLHPSEELKTAKEEVKKQIAVLNSKDFNVTTPKEKLPFNLSGYYWKSVLDYNPTKDILKVKIPILILQGERDYQVTMTDFNLWKKTLKNNKKATFISYPTLNHLFISGEGKPNPDEYQIKKNVDNKVLEDLFTFISK